MKAEQLETTFPCVSITPFGFPVGKEIGYIYSTGWNPKKMPKYDFEATTCKRKTKEVCFVHQ